MKKIHFSSRLLPAVLMLSALFLANSCSHSSTITDSETIDDTVSTETTLTVSSLELKTSADSDYYFAALDGTIDAITLSSGIVRANESFFLKVPVDNGNYKVTLTTNASSVISECITEPVTYYFKNNEGTVFSNNGTYSPNPWTPPTQNNQPMFGITKSITSGTAFEVAVCDGILDLEFVYSSSTINLSAIIIEKEVYTARSKPYLIALGDSTTAQGDSTMSVEANNLSKNYISWAACISNGYLNSELAAAGLGGIVNCAQSGGTVGTVYNDGRIEMLLLNVRPGDYVSINIGINTSKAVTVGGETATIGTLDTEPPIISKYVIEAVKARGGIPYITTITPQGPTSDNDSGVWLTEDTTAVAYSANQRAKGHTYGTEFDTWAATGKAYYAGKEYTVDDTVPAYTWINSRHTGEYCMVLVELANYYEIPVVDFGVYGEKYMNEHYATSTGCATVKNTLYNDKHHYKRAWGEILGKYMLECITKMQDGKTDSNPYGSYTYPFADYKPCFVYMGD